MSTKTRKKTDSNRARRETQSRSYSEEAADDANNAIWELNQFIRFCDVFALRKAARFVKMALSRHDHSEHLQGNTLEEFIDPSPVSSE